jgi:hexulose-6-phosphate isomerase
MGSYYLEAYAEAGLYSMQGRLCAPEQGRFQSFPREGWEREISQAAQVPLRGIEWIYDLYGEGANPLETEQGRSVLATSLAQHAVQVVSICADYFMDCPLLHSDLDVMFRRQSRLEWLISVCPQLGIKRVVLPFVDASRMADSTAMTAVVRILHAVLPSARAAGLELHLETDLGPAEFRAFLREIEDPSVKVNYDSGNSSSLGYRPSDEFSAYGERIGSFHIKDRVLGGKTVPLGEGNADFDSLRSALIDVDYTGDFVLQVARGEPLDELQWLSAMNARACRWLRGESIFD